MELTFTPSQIWGFIIVLIGLILTVLNIIDRYSTLKQRSQQPTEDLRKRLDELEHWQKVVNMRLEEGSRHFGRLDEGFKVVQQSLLALMDDALAENGKHDELQRARDNLYSYLSGK